jgi:hypothetical protein
MEFYGPTPELEMGGGQHIQSRILLQDVREWLSSCHGVAAAGGGQRKNCFGSGETLLRRCWTGTVALTTNTSTDMEE